MSNNHLTEKCETRVPLRRVSGATVSAALFEFKEVLPLHRIHLVVLLDSLINTLTGNERF
jgi:hypothetical protein